jgi:hypothetical protein
VVAKYLTGTEVSQKLQEIQDIIWIAKLIFKYGGIHGFLGADDIMP